MIKDLFTQYQVNVFWNTSVLYHMVTTQTGRDARTINNYHVQSQPDVKHVQMFILFITRACHVNIVHYHSGKGKIWLADNSYMNTADGNYDGPSYHNNNLMIGSLSTPHKWRTIAHFHAFMDIKCISYRGNELLQYKTHFNLYLIPYLTLSI